MRKVVVMTPKEYLQNEITFVSNNDKYILICPKYDGLDHKKKIRIIIER